MAKKENTIEIGFEEQIWKAADKLRGNMDASEYKNVVLGLIFLKFISDKFEDRYQELVAEGEGFEEDRDEYSYKNIFWVPKKARWRVIAKAAHTPEIGKVIDEAMRLIESENGKLKNILPKNFARQELDKRRLGEVVDLFTNVKMSDKDINQDILGRAYEYCLGKFAEAEGRNAGQFYTPSSIVKTLVAIIEPYKGRVYDPCCGSGGMFVQSANFVKKHQGKINDISIFGQESNPTTWKMAIMNLAIRGLDADLGKYNADTFFEDLHKNERFDYVLANPPFNMKDWGGDKLKDDSRWDFGIPSAGNANFAWMQHMIHHLNQKGRLGLVLSNGSLSSSTNNDDAIREAIIKEDIVEGIITLPNNLFYNTTIPACLWIINKSKNAKQKGKVIFVDAKNIGTMENKKFRIFSDEDIANIAQLFSNLRIGIDQNIPGYSAVVSIEEIAKQNFVLTPGRYIGVFEAEEDAEPFMEKMQRLETEFKLMFSESNKLQKVILDNIKEINNG